MAKVSGRKVILWDVTANAMVAGGREHGVTINGELLDITDKGSSGWRELMADVGVRSVDISVSGLLDGDEIIDKALGPTTALLDDYEVRIEGLGTFAGTFALESPELSTPHDAPAEQNFTLKSSGVVAWTAA